MIPFFKKLRKRFADDNKPMKYARYAIGEIILVVIGILIALSINNWNEDRKNRLKEVSYLEEIKGNLIKDTLDLSNLEVVYDLRLMWFKKIDSTFPYKRSKNLAKINKTKTGFEDFIRPRSFRPSLGSYNSLIADGQSALIRNKQLFSKFQKIYEVNSRNLSSTYETLKLRSENILWKHAGKLKNKSPHTNKSMNITNIVNEELITDLNYYYSFVSFYSILCNIHKELIAETIEDIDTELAFLSGG